MVPSLFSKLLKSNLFSKKFVLYSVIGATGAGLDFIVFLLLYNVLGFNALLSTSISITLGITNNFILNTLFNFKLKDSIYHRFISFYTVGLLGLLLSILIIYALHNRIGLDANLAKAASIPIIVVVQFYLNSRVSFGNEKEVRRIFSKNNLLLAAILAVSYAVFMSQITYFGFADEYDNILGGWLITHHGQLPYRDFFSHHMPLTYFVGAVITFFSGNDLNLFRFIYGSALFLWLMFIYAEMKRFFGVKLALGFVLLVSASQYLTWSHMLLAETLIGYSSIHSLLLLFFSKNDDRALFAPRRILLFSILAAVPVLSSLSYAYISLVLYGVFITKWIAHIRSKDFVDNNISTTLKGIGVILAPYILMSGYLLLTGSLGPLKEQAYTFNKLYYSGFSGDVQNGLISTITSSVLEYFRELNALFTTKSSLLALASFFLIVATVLLLMHARRYLLGITLLALTFASSYRNEIVSNIFFSQPNRFGAYSLLVLLTVIIGLYYSSKLKPTDGISTGIASAVVLSTMALVVAILSASITLQLDIRRAQAEDTETGLSLTKDGGRVAEIINRVADNDDYYWVGPFDFYTQLYVSAERSSIYTFFAPWHGACNECEDEIIKSFKDDRPVVVYWQPDLLLLGSDTDVYADKLLPYLSQNYFTIDSEGLEYFYFRNENEAQIRKALK